ncbi:uncharacterized protein [Panulirus ornatus]|uniref:uncharacterized protein n=1 Tax=Panulirus ornatus TaxID=150431 RepID=UPI003A87C9EC
MAPNIPLRDNWNDSDETSQEVEVELQRGPVAQVPEVFASHLPQHFQDPDSPNLHILQRHDIPGRSHHGTTKSPNSSSGSTLTPFRPSSVKSQGLEEVSTQPDSITVSENKTDAHGVDDENIGLRRRPHNNDKTVSQGPTVTTQATRLSPGRHQISSRPQTPGPGLSGSDTPGSFLHITKKTGDRVVPSRSRPRSTTQNVPYPSTTPTSIDHGVLKLPGHEPEAPADLVLVHHERAIDTRNQTGLNGIFVRDDSTVITPQGATALILVGICTVILVFICLILFVQKIRRDKIDRKVAQDADVLKPQPTEEATNSTLHPNPLSLLPPALLHALANLTISAVNRTDEHLHPSFLTMEPLQSSNSLGRLWFSVYYDYVQATLVLRILHARYTKGRGSCTKPGEVWIESCVMTPMNIIKASTTTDKRRASSAPVFNQTFKFKVADEEVTQFLLRMTMYDRHPQNGEKAVGSVIVPLSTVDLCSNNTISRDIQ